MLTRLRPSYRVFPALPRLRKPGRVPVPVVVFAILTAVAVLGPELWNADPLAHNVTERLSDPSWEHPAGTDQFGRDLLARLLVGARWTIFGALSVCALISLIALSLAIVATSGRHLDLVLGRVVEALLAVPGLVTALALTSILGPSFYNLLLALVVTGWPWYVRVYRGVLLSELSSAYVEGAVVAGAGQRRILLRHVLPNVAGPVIVLATANLGFVMLSLASLSFLGLGIQPPTPEWGQMVSESRIYLQSHPWQVLAPGLCILLTVLAVNLAGDALRDALDPRLRGRR